MCLQRCPVKWIFLPVWRGYMITFLVFFVVSSHQRYLWWLHASYLPTPSALQVSLIAVLLCGIICFLLMTKKTMVIHFPLSIYRSEMTHQNISTAIRRSAELCDAKEGYGQLRYAMSASPPVILLVSFYQAAPARSLSMEGREIWGKFIWVSSPSSHCSINTDILRITVPMIKACQSGNYLLLSALPVVILLKPIPSNFRLCEFLSAEAW